MKFQTEVGDQTQYLAHEFNDNTIRFIVKYSGLIHARTLRKAAELLVRRIVVLHSSFQVSRTGTKWKVNETYSTDEITIIREVSGDVLEAAREAALHAIDYAGAVQIRCYLFHNESESALVFLVGHMCADGRDAAYLLQKLIEIYHVLKAGGTGESVELKNGNRSILQCYDQDPEMLSPDLRKIKADHSMQIKSSYSFCTEETGQPCLTECMIPKESLTLCRRLIEKSSVNDVLLAAYCRAYVRQMHLPPDTPVGIATMMDLRKYISHGDSDGVANLSGPVDICLADGIGQDFKQTLSRVTEQTLSAKNDRRAGLDMVLAVRKFYGILPFLLTVRIGKKIYRNMSIGLTNLGNMKRSSLELDNCPVDALIFAGPLKKKPALQLSACGLDGDVRLCIISECMPQEQIQLQELLQIIVSEIRNAAFPPERVSMSTSAAVPQSRSYV